MEKTKNLKITKELFIETIEAIEKQHRHDAECSDAFRVILPYDYISCYENHYLSLQKDLAPHLDGPVKIRIFMPGADFVKKPSGK